MDKFSMFRCFSDIAAERGYYTAGEEHSIMGTLKEELCSEKYRFFDIQYVHGFADLQKLESHAMVKLSEFIDELPELLKVDIYNRINFTCDYLQNYFEKDSENREFASAYFPDAVSYWEEFDDEIDGDDESKLDAFVRNRHKLQMILPEHLVYDEKEKLLKVSKLCPNFGLYMYKNLKGMFWYDKNMSKNYDRLLLSRFLKAEDCYFTDSDYYVLENLTKLIYFNVAKEGIGINPFKRQICYVDGIPQDEDMDSMVYRILGILTKGLKITAKKQKLKLQRSLYKQIYEEGEAASVPYLYASLAGTELGEILRCISKCKWYSHKLNWKELLQNGNILVIQLSDVDTARRYMFAEMILSDLWGEIIKGQLGKFLICLDEIHNLNLNSGSAVHKMLRESRKYGVAMLLSTQFVGNLKDREVKLALEQAAQKVFFRPPESNLLSIARSIDVENRQKWQGILQGLGVFEYIFSGNGIVEGTAYDLKCKLKLK